MKECDIGIFWKHRLGKVPQAYHFKPLWFFLNLCPLFLSFDTEHISSEPNNMLSKDDCLGVLWILMCLILAKIFYFKSSYCRRNLIVYRNWTQLYFALMDESLLMSKRDLYLIFQTSTNLTLCLLFLLITKVRNKQTNKKASSRNESKIKQTNKNNKTTTKEY